MILQHTTPYPDSPDWHGLGAPPVSAAEVASIFWPVLACMAAWVAVQVLVNLGPGNDGEVSQ